MCVPELGEIEPPRLISTVIDMSASDHWEEGSVITDLALEMATEFDSLSSFLSHTGDSDQALSQIVKLAVELIPGCSGASITRVKRDETGLTLAASDDNVTLALDAIQYDVHDGPCWQMAVEDDPDVVSAPDLHAEGRWPDFVARAVAETPVRSVTSFGLAPGLERTALNLYGAQPHWLTTEGAASGALFAVHAQVVVRQIKAENRATHLQTALSTSRTIGSAVGMIMWIHKVSEQEAFDVLRRTSQNLNIKVRDLAAHVALTGEVPVPSRGGTGV